MTGHLGELKLRRMRAGEFQGIEAHEVQGHIAECAHCRSRLKALEQEQHQFEQEISFDRFAAGVERAIKTTTAPRRHMERMGIHARSRWMVPAMGTAAVVLIAIVVAPLLKGAPGTRLKGGAGIVLRVGGPAADSQRTASGQAPEALGPGERVRIGYQAGGHPYLAAVSIDEQGVVTPLYPEAGKSIRVPPGDETRYLPGSLEFTGKGSERVIVILSDEPLDLSRVKNAAKTAYDEAHGDLQRLPKLNLPGEQFHRLLLKP